MDSMVAQSPYVRGDGFCLFGSELRAAHGRHRAAILFWRHYTVGDGFGESFPATVTPEPFVFGQVGAERRSIAGGSMAGGTRGSADFAMIDAVAERNHLLRGSNWHGKRGISSVSVRTFGRLGGSAYGFADRSGETGTGSEAGLGPTDVGDAVDAAFHVVGDIQGAVRSDSNSRGAMDGAFRRDDTAGKSVGEDLAPAGGTAGRESLEDDVIAALGVRCTVP